MSDMELFAVYVAGMAFTGGVAGGLKASPFLAFMVALLWPLAVVAATLAAPCAAGYVAVRRLRPTAEEKQ